MARGACILLGGLALAVATAPSQARAAGPCSLAATASADDSFAKAGYDSSPARLSKLVALTRQRLAAAAGRLCASKVLAPADLARIRRLIVQNGEGATEPLLYRTPEMASGAYVFQFAFQDGGPPEPAAFEQALRCWKRPGSCDLGD